MQGFNTIHIFGFGTVQIISPTVNKSVPASGLNALAAFITFVQSLKPSDVLSTTYHSININYGIDVRYLGRCTSNKTDKLSFSVKWADVDLNLLEALINQIISA